MTPVLYLIALNLLFFLTFVVVGIRIDRHNRHAREHKKYKHRNRHTTWEY